MMRKFLAKILSLIAIIALIAMAVLLVAISAGVAVPAITVFGTSLSATAFAYSVVAISVGLIVLAYMLNPEVTQKTLAKAGKGVAAIGAAIGTAVGGFAKSLLSSSGIIRPLLIFGCLVFGYRFLSNEKKIKAVTNRYEDSFSLSNRKLSRSHEHRNKTIVSKDDDSLYSKEKE